MEQSKPAGCELRVTRRGYAILRRAIADAEAACFTQAAIDQAAPRVLRQLFPEREVMISDAIAAGKPINIHIIDDGPPTTG